MKKLVPELHTPNPPGELAFPHRSLKSGNSAGFFCFEFALNTASLPQVTCSDPDPAAGDVHHRRSTPVQPAVWPFSGEFRSASFALSPLSQLDSSDALWDSAVYSSDFFNSCFAMSSSSGTFFPAAAPFNVP